MHKKFSIKIVHTKVINCKSASKSFLLQVVHTKAIAALTQFCDFFYLCQRLQTVKLFVAGEHCGVEAQFLPLSVLSFATKSFLLVSVRHYPKPCLTHTLRSNGNLKQLDGIHMIVNCEILKQDAWSMNNIVLSCIEV